MRHRLRNVHTMLVETRAMLTQARYLAADWRSQDFGSADTHVVLVHGLYATAGVFRPLRSALLRDLGVGASTFSYFPGPGIGELTGRLRKVLQTLPSTQPIVLVGHSLGGLVVRNYVLEFADTPIQLTISLAAPFSGSRRFHLVPGQAGRDLIPGAEILAPLSRDSAAHRAVPHLSLLAADDRLVLGPALPSYGERCVIQDTGHNGILFHEQAIAAVVERVALASARRRRSSVR